jgi:hypothetical protein
MTRLGLIYFLLYFALKIPHNKYQEVLKKWKT